MNRRRGKVLIGFVVLLVVGSTHGARGAILLFGDKNLSPWVTDELAQSCDRGRVKIAINRRRPLTRRYSSP